MTDGAPLLTPTATTIDRDPMSLGTQTAGLRPTRVGILTHTAVADDPRVRRQIEAFGDAGWDVVAVGTEGGRSSPPDAHLDLAPARPADRSIAGRLHRLSVLSVSKVAPFTADRMFWLLPEQYGDFLKRARRYQPDLWIANDWTMLPVATALVRERPAPVLYDSHEFAYDEFPENWKWRIFVRPLVRKLEAEGISRVGAVTCVSAGIARRLQAVYGLQDEPTVVRNMPRYEDVPFRACGEDIKVLYHGIVTPNRGLEQIIRSLSLWRPQFTLAIRGPADGSYLSALKALAEAEGVAGRVRFEPPVPLVRLVQAAADHDVGIFVLPAHSQQNEFVLPNKLFEYAMAGLCLCVSDLPEMAAVVRTNDLGRLIDGTSPERIAAAVNSLDRASIDRAKVRSLTAARDMCWEREREKLLAIASRLVSDARSPAALRHGH
ncbi:MAG: glycosyltransferase [Alsobacter sp.]